MKLQKVLNETRYHPVLQKLDKALEDSSRNGIEWMEDYKLNDFLKRTGLKKAELLKWHNAGGPDSSDFPLRINGNTVHLGDPMVD